MVTNELPLFPAWIIAHYALKYICFVEGIERCHSCIDVFCSGFLSETFISWISKLCQITTILLTPALGGLFFTVKSIISVTKQKLWNSTYKLKNCSSTATQALEIKDQGVQTSRCSFLPFSSFITLGFATCFCDQDVVTGSLFLQQSPWAIRTEEFRGVFSCARTVRTPCSPYLTPGYALLVFSPQLWCSLAPSWAPSASQNQSSFLEVL